MVNSRHLIFSGTWFTPEAYLSRTKQHLPENGTFYEIIHKKLQEKGLYGKDNKKLIATTHLSGTICSKLKNDPDYNPDTKTIIALCIGVRFSEKETYHLLKLKKRMLSPEDPIHCAYMDLLHVYEILELGVQECNELLHSWGIDKKHFLWSIGLDEVI